MRTAKIFRDYAQRYLSAAAIVVIVASLFLGIWIGKELLTRLLLALERGSVDDINKLLLAFAGLGSVPFLIWRTWIADRQKHIAQENLYTSLLTKAVDQLGATREEKSEDGKTRTVPNTEVRLGSIYALEKLARDYLPLHWQIMEILCAYVRGNAGPSKPCSDKIRAMYARPWKDRVHEAEDLLMRHEDTLREPSVDVQVALTVIGRRSGTQREFEKQVADGVDTQLDLARCHLARVNLIGLHFENALLHESCLEGATLEGTYFYGARLFSTR